MRLCTTIGSETICWAPSYAKFISPGSFLACNNLCLNSAQKCRFLKADPACFPQHNFYFLSFFVCFFNYYYYFRQCFGQRGLSGEHEERWVHPNRGECGACPSSNPPHPVCVSTSLYHAEFPGKVLSWKCRRTLPGGAGNAPVQTGLFL